MKTIIVAATAVSLLALPACTRHPMGGGNSAAQSASADPINGTWKADINSVQFETKPDELLLQNGTYSCKSCTPPYSVAADGAFHPVSMPYFDSDALKVVDDHSVTETSKKGDRVTGETTMTVSPDGNRLTGSFTDTSAGGAPVKGQFTETRVGPAPAGAHAISGQWKPTKLSNFNDAALTFTLNVNGDTFQSSSPNGTSFEAKVGGADVPIKGDTGGTTVSVAKGADNSYTETRKRDGKIVNVVTMMVSADGKLNAVSQDKENGSTTRWQANKLS